MTPKEKAIDLFNQYFSKMSPPSDCEGCMVCVNVCGNLVAVAKSYALIAVNEVVEFMNSHDLKTDTCSWANSQELLYWFEVKKEIEQYEPE